MNHTCKSRIAGMPRRRPYAYQQRHALYERACQAFTAACQLPLVAVASAPPTRDTRAVNKAARASFSRPSPRQRVSASSRPSPVPHVVPVTARTNSSTDFVYSGSESRSRNGRRSAALSTHHYSREIAAPQRATSPRLHETGKPAATSTIKRAGSGCPRAAAACCAAA